MYNDNDDIINSPAPPKTSFIRSSADRMSMFFFRLHNLQREQENKRKKSVAQQRQRQRRGAKVFRSDSDTTGHLTLAPSRLFEKTPVNPSDSLDEIALQIPRYIVLIDLLFHLQPPRCESVPWAIRRYFDRFFVRWNSDLPAEGARCSSGCTKKRMRAIYSPGDESFQFLLSIRRNVQRKNSKNGYNVFHEPQRLDHFTRANKLVRINTLRPRAASISNAPTWCHQWISLLFFILNQSKCSLSRKKWRTKGTRDSNEKLEITSQFLRFVCRTKCVRRVEKKLNECISALTGI